MNELLRKSIDDLGIIERTRGYDSPQAIEKRSELEGLYKAMKASSTTTAPEDDEDEEEDDTKKTAAAE